MKTSRKNNSMMCLTLALVSYSAANAQYTVSSPVLTGTMPVGVVSSTGVTVAVGGGVFAYGLNAGGSVCGVAPEVSTIQAFGFIPTTPNASFGKTGSLGSPASSYGPSWSICRAISKSYAVGFGWDPLDGSVIAMQFSIADAKGATTPPVMLGRLTEDPAYIPNSYAYAVSDTGLAAGMLTVSPGVNHAVYWKLTTGGSASMVDISSATSDFVLNAAYGVNNLGQIVGYGVHKSTGKVHGFIYTLGKGVVDIGSLDTTDPGADFSVATAINDLGVVVGYAMKPDIIGLVATPATPMAPFHHCFVFSGGSMKDLGMPPNPPGFLPNKNCIASSINIHNEIAGWANVNPGGASEMMGMGVVFEPTPAKLKAGMKPGWNNLNLVPHTGFLPMLTIRAAVAINDFGQILGPGSPETIMDPVAEGGPVFPFALLLTPPPPPPASTKTNF